MNKRCFLGLWLLVVPLQWAFGQTNIDSTRIVRVLSYNIYHGETVGLDKQFDLDELARIINDEKPDLVALQEVDFKTNRVLKKDLVTELGLRTKMQAIFGKAMSFDGGEYGVGVLSDYSFLSTKNHTLVVREGNEPRAALEVNVIIKSNDTIKFIGTHLDHTNIETDRIDQAKQINDLFAIDEVPTILAGDLNALPGSETMHVFYKYWKQSFLGNAPTYPAQEPRDKIDYILFKPANRWRVLETKVIDEKLASDHRAILSVLELLKK